MPICSAERTRCTTATCRTTAIDRVSGACIPLRALHGGGNPVDRPLLQFVTGLIGSTLSIREPSMIQILQRRSVGRLMLAGLLLAGAAAFVRPVLAADEAPDALVKRLSTDVLETIKADKSIKAGDVNKIMALVDSKIMPNVNFQRMTASAVGPAWRQA